MSIFFTRKHDEILGETQESVLKRLSAREGSTVHTIQLEQAPTAAESNQIFFSHVRSYLNSRDTFNDTIFQMKGVGIGMCLTMLKLEAVCPR